MCIYNLKVNKLIRCATTLDYSSIAFYSVRIAHTRTKRRDIQIQKRKAFDFEFMIVSENPYFIECLHKYWILLSFAYSKIG